MAVAATFLTGVRDLRTCPGRSAPQQRRRLAIDAAISAPEHCQCPPPTVNDFKLDATASVPDAAENNGEGRGDKTIPMPRDQTIPIRHRSGCRCQQGGDATAATPPRQPTQRRCRGPPRNRRRLSATVPPADQPVADRLREMLAAKSAALFRAAGRTDAVEKFYTTREFAPLWTQGGVVTESGKRVTRVLKDAAPMA